MNKSKIVIFCGVSQYDVYDYWIKELSQALVEEGFSPYIVDLSNKATVQETLAAAFDPPPYFFLGFNGMGVEFQEHYHVYDKVKRPFVAIYVDHPAFHDNRLNVYSSYLLSTFVDPLHIRYASAHYPEGNYALFPHAASSYERTKAPSSPRSYDLICAGSYSVADWAALSPVSRHLLNDLIAGYEEKPDLGYDELLESLSDLNLIVYLDHYIRNKHREQVLTTLSDHGISVDLFGDGWDLLPTARFHRCHGPVSYEAILKAMGESKCVLNISPNFSNGSHERLLSAMACGALAITDKRAFFDPRLEADKTLLTYSYSTLGGLPYQIETILDNDGKREEIASKGQHLALKEHSWKVRAHSLLGLISGL